MPSPRLLGRPEKRSASSLRLWSFRSVSKTTTHKRTNASAAQ
uniref:Uncharacterized protein n=1 Tax=Aegilops tauschii subsp. strangulata TaxID=200361 RepID=A0A453RRL8_AEGTS